MKNTYLFLDRDGTIIKEPPDEQIDTLEKLELLPSVIRNLYRLTHFLDYKLVMVTNQDGLGTVDYPLEAYEKVQSKLIKTLSNEGIEFENIRVDTSKKEAPSENRKPSIGLIQDYLDEDIDMERSVVIGDRLTDLDMAGNAGLKGIWFANGGENPGAERSRFCLAVTDDWDRIFYILNSLDRSVNIARSTSETEISGTLSLNGSGISDIKTGMGFFDHMLEQIPRHGAIDLQLTTKGDLHVDEHHTIEDTGLAIGEAFRRALKNKKGLKRYGFYVPMDESVANCVVDFGGRSSLVWEVDFNREKIGDVPTEMFEHFFSSFAAEAQCNIHITASGKNEHHKIEAVFKAFARALKMAVDQDVESSEQPSTKGVIF